MTLAAMPSLSSLPPWAFPAFLALASAGVLWALWRADAVRPTSFKTTPAGQRDVFGVPAAIWFVCAAVVFLGQTVAAGIGHGAAARLAPGAGSAQEKAITVLVMYPLAIALAAVVLYLLSPRTSERTGLRVRASDAGPGIIAALAAAPILMLASVAAQAGAGMIRGRATDPVGHETLKLLVAGPVDVWGWALIAGACVGAPIVEEILYRGLLQSCFLALLGRTWPAILATSAVFAAVHAAVVPPEALAVLFVLSVAFGVAFERTRRLGVPIAMHVLFNAANVAVTLLTARGG